MLSNAYYLYPMLEFLVPSSEATDLHVHTGDETQISLVGAYVQIWTYNHIISQRT